MENLSNQLAMMEKYRLTAEESLLVELLFLASIEEKHDEYLIRYFSLPIDKSDLRDLLLSLQSKGIINKSYKIPAKGIKFDPESVEFNKNFLHNYRKYSGELGIEFFKEYPSIGLIKGIEVPLKNYAKKFNSEEELYFQYGKNIGWKLDKHKEVIELIRWGKENKTNLLTMNIADFVISKMWESLKELKEGDNLLTFDTTAEL